MQLFSVEERHEYGAAEGAFRLACILKSNQVKARMDIEQRREHYGISYVTILKEHVDAFALVVERLADR